MKSASKKLLVIAIAMAIVPIALFFLFRIVHEPQLALREMQKGPARDPSEAERLLRLAEGGRFDLTDTLALARMLENMNRIDDALAIFRALTIRYPEAPVIRLWFAERLQRYGRWTEAEVLYLELLEELDSGLRQDAPFGRSRVWSAREQELAIARRVVSLPDDVGPISEEDLYRKLAENAMSAAMASKGDERGKWFDKSRRFFISCLEINPDNHEARGAYANLLLQTDNPAESLLNYQALLKAEPENLGWLISAAIAAGANRQFDLAERYVRSALRIDTRKEWRLKLVRFLSWGGKHDAALNELDFLLEDHPGAFDYSRERADVLLNAGRNREYLEETARLVAIHPLDLDLRLSRVRAMIGMNMFSEAIHESAAVLAIDPDNYEASLLRAEALLWSGDYHVAEAELLILARRLPGDPLVRKRLAQSRLWSRQYKEALASFRELNPAAMDDLEVAQGFAEAFAGIKDTRPEDSAVIQSMFDAILLEPDLEWPVPLLAAVGRALREMGENNAAVTLLGTATKRAAANLKLRLELADLLQAIGRHDEADKQYRFITNGTKESK